MTTRTRTGAAREPDRSLVAGRAEVACYVLVLLAAPVRVFVPLLAPEATVGALLASAALWSAGFALYAIAYWPVLTRPRLDGKPG